MQENIAYNKITAAANVSMQALANQACDSQIEVETTTHITVTLPSQEMQAGAIPVKDTMTTTDNHLYAVLEEQCTHPHDNDNTTNEGHVYAVLEDTSTTLTTVPRSMDSHQHND